MHQLQLHVEGQAGGDAVWVDFVAGETFGLKKQLMAGFACEAVDLVFDRRAIARPHALDHAGIHRRPVQGAANDFVSPLVGMSDPARQLAGMHVAPPHEGKHGLRGVAGLLLQPGKIDAAGVETWRRPGLQSTHRKTHFPQLGGERAGSGIPGATCLIVSQTDMYQPGEERSGRQHNRLCVEAQAQLRRYPDHARSLEQQVIHGLLKDHQIGLVLNSPANGLPIQHPISLRARRPHRRALG